MADFDSSAPVRTETDGDVGVRVVGSTPANVLDIDGDGIAPVKLTDGTNTLTPNADGSVNVVVQTGVSGGEVHVYGTTSGTAPSTPTTVATYTVTALKTLKLFGWKCAGSGKAKYSLKIGVAAAEVEKDVSFIDSVSGNFETVFPQPIEVPAGQVVLVEGTNRDKANADLYAWINGEEV